MLAYAANRPIVAQRRSSPNAMLAIIAAHVALVAVVMSAKMDLPTAIKHSPVDVFWVPKPADPPPNPPIDDSVQPPLTHSSYVPPIVPTPAPLTQNPAVPNMNPADPGTLGGAAVIPEIPAIHNPVRLGPVLTTPASEIKPPYPESKLASGEEALLRLRLTIDERGRVIAVEPVGRADRVFLEAARRHLMAHWRYRPASEDGRPLTSSAVITLRFQLDG